MSLSQKNKKFKIVLETLPYYSGSLDNLCLWDCFYYLISLFSFSIFLSHFFLFFKHMYFGSGCRGPPGFARALSSCAVGASLRSSVLASHCAASLVAEDGLSHRPRCPMACGTFLIRDRTCVSGPAGQTPTHCTTKEAPVSFLLVLRTHSFSVMIRPLKINKQCG